MTSSTIENYLKAIFELETSNRAAKTTQLAEKLGIKAGTVSGMLKRLSRDKPRLITYKHHQGARLTAKGRRIALDVIRRHRLLETFLHEILGLTWDEVHEEAEILEHHLSVRVTEAIDRHLNFPEFDPHGEPIPNQDGDMAPQSAVKLTALEVGDTFQVVRVEPTSAKLLAYLQSENIGIHSFGKVLTKAPLDGPITIRVGTRGTMTEHTLGRNVADYVYVESA